MKKCLLLTIGLVLLLTSCASTNGIKKEKDDDGLFRYSDVILDTIRYENPKLVPDVDGGKFNLHKGSDSENINAYVENNQFYLKAAYECKSPNLLKINTIIFTNLNEKLVFKKTRVLPSDLDVADYHYEQLINPYFSYSSVNNYSYEEFKTVLTTDEVNQLADLLEGGTCYVCFVGERGRTDLFKLSKKINIALRSIIEKYQYLLLPEVTTEEDFDYEDELTEDTDYSDDTYLDEYTDEDDVYLDGEDTYTDEYDLSDDTTISLEEEDTTDSTETTEIVLEEDTTDVVLDETETVETTEDTTTVDTVLGE